MGSAGGKEKGEKVGTDLSAASAVRPAQLCHCAGLKWVWLCQTSLVPMQHVWTRSLSCNVDNRVSSEFWLCLLRASGCYLFYTSPVLNSEYLLGQKDGKFPNTAGKFECLVTTLQSRVVSPKKWSPRAGGVQQQ